MMVGRAVDHIFPERQPNIGAPVLAVSDLSHPTEFDGISFELRKRRNPRLLRAGRAQGAAS